MFSKYLEFQIFTCGTAPNVDNSMELQLRKLRATQSASERAVRGMDDREATDGFRGLLDKPEKADSVMERYVNLWMVVLVLPIWTGVL